MSFHGGKLRILYYDLREDVSGLFGPYIDELPILNGPIPRIRHTIDVFVAQASPGGAPTFTTARVSEYASGFLPGSTVEQRLQFDPPNLPLFRQGFRAVHGRLYRLAPAPPFVLNENGTWSFNTGASGSVVSHAVWTDNRDVRPPADGNWANYTPVTSPAVGTRAASIRPSRCQVASRARSGCATRTSTRRASPTACSSRPRATTSSSTAFSAPSSSSRRMRRRCRASTGCASRTSRWVARRRSCSSARRCRRSTFPRRRCRPSRGPSSRCSVAGRRSLFSAKAAEPTESSAGPPRAGPPAFEDAVALRPSRRCGRTRPCGRVRGAVRHR